MAKGSVVCLFSAPLVYGRYARLCRMGGRQKTVLCCSLIDDIMR